MTRRHPLRWMVSLVVAGLLAASCTGDDGPGPEQARLDVDGSATVVDADGGTETVTGGATLDFGDTVTVDDGDATIELADGSRFELRRGDGAIGSSVRVGSPMELLDGEVLAIDGFPSSIVVDQVTVGANGVVRLDADASRAVVYSGRATLAGVGDVVELDALRQLVLSPSAAIMPVAYDGTDDWDRRYLGAAVAFGERLESLARGYTTQLRGTGTVSFFSAVIPALGEEREFNDDLLVEDRSAGETLIGAAIAVQGRDGTFRERWDEVFEFRAMGAAWGIVALDQGVSSAPVLDTIEQAIAATPSAPDPRPVTTTSPPSTTTTTTTPGPGPTTTTTTPPPTAPPPPPPEEPPGLLEPILDPVRSVVDELFDTLGLG